MYRVLVRFGNEEVDCLVAVRHETSARWLACADVVVDDEAAVVAAAVGYAWWISASRAATCPARGSADDS